MYAVIVSGGKQHRVTEGEVLKLEKIEIETGGSVEFDRVLLVANGEDVKIGEPNVPGAKVTAEVVSHGRHDKVKIMKFKRRKHHMKQMGHRQWYTEVKITGFKSSVPQTMKTTLRNNKLLLSSRQIPQHFLGININNRSPHRYLQKHILPTSTRTIATTP